MKAPARDGERREFPFWLLAAILIGLFLCWLFVADGNYNTILRALTHGVFTTVWVSIVAYFSAAVVGLVLALARSARFRLLREVATFYIELVRGIPPLVLLFYVALVGAPALVAASDKLRTTLGWSPQYADLDKIVGDAWNFARKHALTK